MALDPSDLFDFDSELGTEQRTIRDVVARFVDEKVLPTIARDFDAQRFPRELIAELADLGILGGSIEGYDCPGLDPLSYGLICQQLERGDSALRSFVSVQSSLCMYPIDAFGSAEQKSRYLPAMARGELIGCFGLTESQGGSDPGAMRTRAERRGDEWVLTGEKTWITNAPIADVALVWASTAEGVRGFLIDTDTTGFEAREIERKYSLRASTTGTIFLDDVVIPDSQRLPGTEVGLKAALACLTQARFGIAFGVLGAAEACFREALDYCGTREMFGRPLSATQGVQLRLAEMARKLATGQTLALQLARNKARGRLHPVQVSIAKWNNCRAAIEIAREARDLLGGAGITSEHAAIRHALNLESVITYEGTETVHQLAVGRELTGHNAF
ncbi:MAG: acyl-CoA dehydrogenase [Gammaproteobacteria bacterium]|nr:acyl-CoA dehydrogenase [Gammaproteobacteria bacterium]